jgi:hypothetical protein
MALCIPPRRMMGVLKRRTRVISFRLSDEEYQALLQITAAQGARSISDFSRTVVFQALMGNSSPLYLEQEHAFLSQVRDLIKSMQELGSVIATLLGQLERESTSVMKRAATYLNKYRIGDSFLS